MSSAATAWFAIKVKSRHEKLVSEALKNKGFEQYLPLYVCRSQSGKRAPETHYLPLFPCYVFCRFNPRYRVPILTTRGVIPIVSYGHEPAEIDAKEIESVRAVTYSGVELSPCPYIAAGDEVTIHGGPLDGVNGLMMKHKSGGRVIISIHMIQRSVSVEVDLHRISPRMAKANLQRAS
jgi:transcriptional antiterminator NusG